MPTKPHIPTDAELDAAREHYAHRLTMEPLATSVRYDGVGDTIIIEMNNGAALTIPRRLLQGLTNATREDLDRGEVCGDGTWINFEGPDAQFTIMSLLVGVYGGKRWMAERARLGGVVRSEAKTIAARENGRKGGRPRKKAKA